MPAQQRTGIIISVGAVGVLLTLVLYLMRVATEAGQLTARIDAIGSHEERIRSCERVGDRILTKLDDLCAGQARVERKIDSHMNHDEKGRP